MQPDLETPIRTAWRQLRVRGWESDAQAIQDAAGTLFDAIRAIGDSRQGARCEGPRCSEVLEYAKFGPARQYCSDACRQRAYRERRTARKAG